MLSRITVAVCVPMAGVGGFARRNWIPCDLWQFCLRLSFHPGGAAVVISSLIGTTVYICGIILQGVLIRRAGFPLYVTFSRHNVSLPMYWFATVFCEEPGRVSV